MALAPTARSGWRIVLHAPAGLTMLLLWQFASGAAVLAAAAPQSAATAILVIGDSQAQGVTGALQRLFLRDRRFHVLDRTKVGTGITLKATYDWPAAVEALVSAEKADVAVVMFGANDRPPIRIKGVIDTALGESFRKIYESRVKRIINLLRGANMTVIWLGNPIVRDASYAEDLAFLNNVLETVTQAEGARWVPISDIATDSDGNYTAHGEGVDGKTTRLRADDGVHFTAAGYDLIAKRLQPLMESYRAEHVANPAPRP
ncbi:MAG TPA: DUF459 domain-containing protein [Alphaproteobacteria bacterium]|nr:DUF459 domain-containing protein [Alphaproteobacteria bacterium]